MSAPEIGEIPLGSMVKVTWYDAWSDNDTSDRRDWKDELLVATEGTLERDTERIVTVAGEQFPGESNTFRGVTHIPRSVVESIKVLR